MTKSDLVSKVRDALGCPNATAASAVDTVFRAIYDELAAGREVQILGFGTFRVVERAERKGRNPRTGEEITIPASKGVHFVQGKHLKTAVNA